jgi:hypothetical protein
MDTLLTRTRLIRIPSPGRHLLRPLEASFLKDPLGIFHLRISFIKG